MDVLRDKVINRVIDFMESGLVPDRVTRAGMRRLCGERLATYARMGPAELQTAEQAYTEELLRSPVAVHTDAANRQHYEVPSEFFALALGPQRKYSCAYFGPDTKDLAAAETEALDLTMKRAELEDGMDILELGAGWGSLALAMAARFPKAKITTVSNSRTQRAYIEEQAERKNFKHLKVVTRDVAEVTDMKKEFGEFDRVVSVEMFEHLRNYGLLFNRIAQALREDGKLFCHIFTHDKYSYFFESEGEDNWMGRYFFTGGQMPSRQLLHYFQRDLTLQKQWSWDGTHYARTADAWLANMDANRAAIRKLFRSTYGPMEADRWVQRWRMFFLACSELFGYADGSEWFVSHYLFEKRLARA